MDSPFNARGMCAILTFSVIENNEIYRATEGNICTAPLHDHENGNFYFISRDRK